MKIHETPHEGVIHFHESPIIAHLSSGPLGLGAQKNSGGVRENSLDGTEDVQIYG